MPFVKKYEKNMKLRLVTGFTLVELVVTVALIGIAVGLGVPAFQRFIESGRLTAAANDLLTDATFARMEAIKRKGGLTAGQVGQVVMCTSSDAMNCTTGATEWGSGWIVFWDQDRSGTFTAADVMLKVHGALPASLTAVTTPANVTRISFDSTGALQDSLTNITISSTHTNQGRSISFGPLGQIAIVRNISHGGH
jgi:type IV fimbrial biogenesis protein FimT